MSIDLGSVSYWKYSTQEMIDQIKPDWIEAEEPPPDVIAAYLTTALLFAAVNSKAAPKDLKKFSEGQENELHVGDTITSEAKSAYYAILSLLELIQENAKS